MEAIEEVAVGAIEEIDTEAEPIRVDTKPDIVGTDADLQHLLRCSSPRFQLLRLYTSTSGSVAKTKLRENWHFQP